MNIGNREQVWAGLAYRTKAGLKKEDLMLDAKGKVISRKISERRRGKGPIVGSYEDVYHGIADETYNGFTREYLYEEDGKIKLDVNVKLRQAHENKVCRFEDRKRAISRGYAYGPLNEDDSFLLDLVCEKVRFDREKFKLIKLRYEKIVKDYYDLIAFDIGAVEDAMKEHLLYKRCYPGLEINGGCEVLINKYFSVVEYYFYHALMC